MNHDNNTATTQSTQPTPLPAAFPPQAPRGGGSAWPRQPGEHFITEWAAHHVEATRHNH